MSAREMRSHGAARAQLPLEGSPPHQLHIIDFGIASKIDALGATKGQQPCVAHALLRRLAGGSLSAPRPALTP